MTKGHVLEEIRRTAAANGGTALGVARFEQETAIKPWDWQKYWARFGDAVREAGCVQSEFRIAYNESELLRKYALLTRELRRLPVRGDLRVKAHADPEFPSDKVFNRWGAKPDLIKRLVAYCKEQSQYEDVISLCSEYSSRGRNTADEDSVRVVGFVYLTKSGRFHKIGKTNAAGRREYELAIQLPEKAVQVHVIETDDPNGIEAYWHNRFRDKRKNGEWFDLNPTDVAAFKKWRKIV